MCAAGVDQYLGLFHYFHLGVALLDRVIYMLGFSMHFLVIIITSMSAAVSTNGPIAFPVETLYKLTKPGPSWVMCLLNGDICSAICFVTSALISETLMVFITEQNVVGINAVVSASAIPIMYFQFCG